MGERLLLFGLRSLTLTPGRKTMKSMRKFASMFAEKGFTCLELDLAPPAKPAKSSQALMEHFEGGTLSKSSCVQRLASSKRLRVLAHSIWSYKLVALER